MSQNIEQFESRWAHLFRKWHKAFPSSGHLAFSCFYIALLSGVVLLIPFDPNKPYQSLQEMLLGNPGAVFFRGLHFWSGHLFLIFGAVHVVDHLSRSKERKLTYWKWLKIALILPCTGYIMVSGFILRADSESIQAAFILQELVSSIPGFGNEFAFALLGPEGTYQIPFGHHIGSMSILILLFITEHIRRIWPSAPAFLFIISGVVVVSFVVQPGLHDPLDPSISGPWYFIGFQELLHWTSNKLIIIGLCLSLYCLFLIIPFISPSAARKVKLCLLTALVIYSLLSLVGWLFRGVNGVLSS